MSGTGSDINSKESVIQTRIQSRYVINDCVKRAVSVSSSV